MTKPPVSTVLMSQKNAACAGTGLLMGQIVMGISAFHNGSIVGLTLALVFVLAGGASLALFLSHLHVERHARTVPAPVQAWLLTLGSAFIASIWFGRFL
jgi:hypothetical protein